MFLYVCSLACFDGDIYISPPSLSYPAGGAIFPQKEASVPRTRLFFSLASPRSFAFVSSRLVSCKMPHVPRDVVENV